MRQTLIQLKESRVRTGRGWCCGTFGELVQGVLPDERNFLVTLPIARQSAATFTPVPDAGIHVFPRSKTKARRLAEELLAMAGRPAMGGVLTLHSELPEGKGLASSSADLVATARALQSALGFSIAPDVLAAAMARIEPSDGVMYRGVVSFYHREGVLRKFLGPLPVLTIAAVDEGGVVDTLDFNRRPQTVTAAEKQAYLRLLAQTERAVEAGDLAALGECATQSAILNQRLLPKASLDLFLDLRRRCRAPGVVVAHSGTYVGLLLDPAAPSYVQDLSGVVEELSRTSLDLSICHTIGYSGGRPTREI